MRVPFRHLPAEIAHPSTARTGVDRSFGSLLMLALHAVSLLILVGTVATKLWQDHVWLGFVLLVLALVVWARELTRDRVRRWWFVYVAGIFFYTLLRSYADETSIPVQTAYVIKADHLLFFGSDPVVWLQQRLFSPSHLTLLDFAAVQVHWSFFIAPHLLAVVVFAWKRHLFPRYAVLVVGTMYVGLILFFLVPTTPPWLAARAGDLPETFRIMDFVGGRVDAGTYRTFSASLGEPNSVAAMPSIHMAVTFAMYLWAREHQPRLAPWLLVYAAVMGLALIYLAEHYVLDLIVGVACASLCHVASRRLVGVQAPDHALLEADG